MKSLYKVLVLAALMISGSAFAQVSATKHNLTGGTTTDNGQICVYCHAPHTNSTSTSPPLWNHDPTAVNPYTTYTSTTMDMDVGQPGPESLVCLSCHDGTVALDAIINEPQSGWTQGASRLMANTADGYMGTDLRSEHPIGVTWDITSATGDPDFNTVASVEDSGNGLPLFTVNEVMECATCHDVHEYTNVPFLRETNANSQLCLTCHIK